MAAFGTSRHLGAIRNLVAYKAQRTLIEPHRSSSIHKDAPEGSALSRAVRPDPHRLLAEIGARPVFLPPNLGYRGYGGVRDNSVVHSAKDGSADRHGADRSARIVGDCCRLLHLPSMASRGGRKRGRPSAAFLDRGV